MRKEVKDTLSRQDDPEYKAIIDGELLVMECLEEVCKCMEDEGISNKDMAKMLGVTLHYWESVLADNTISVRFLGYVASRLGMKTVIRLEPEDD